MSSTTRRAAGAEERDRVGEPGRVDGGADGVEQLAVPGDPRLHGDPVGDEAADGLDEIEEALLLHHPAHRGDAQRALGGHGLRIGVGEAVELEPVVDELDAVGGLRVAPPQVLEVVLGDRNDVVGAGDGEAEPGGVDGVVEQVLRVGRHRVLDPREGCRDLGGAPGERAEVGMEMGDAALGGRARELDRLVDVGGVVAGELREQRGVALGEPGDRRGRTGVHLPGVGELVRLRHEVHGRLDPCDLRVEPGVGGGTEREDLEVLPGVLAGEDLGDDERLGEARVDLDDVGGAALGGRSDGFSLQH